MRRRLAIAIAVAGPGCVLATLLCGPTLAQPSPTQAYYDFVHWVSVGEFDKALAQFADNAVVVAEPACGVAAPCVGKAAIRERYLVALRHRQLPLPLSDQRFDGSHLRTCGDDTGRQLPLKGAHKIELKQGRIAALRFEPVPCSEFWRTQRWPGAALSDT